MKDSQKQIYLDYAAATPLSEKAQAAMDSHWREGFANPQSTHEPGRKAHDFVAAARDSIANILGAQASEVVFTSGATEANSLAILGAARAFRLRQEISRPQVLLSEIAHGSVVEVSESFSSKIDVAHMPVDSSGRIILDKIKDLLAKKTAVVSFSHANSEIGTLQPVRNITKIIHHWRQNNQRNYPLVHLDASQSFLYEDVTPEKLGVDLLTLNPSKAFGPKGVGVLWVKGGTPLSPIMIAGSELVVGDYQKIRTGTPPTPLIVGAANSLNAAAQHAPDRAEAVAALRDWFAQRLRDEFKKVVINGSQKHRIAHNLNITFPGVDHDLLAAQLDARGIAASTTSACQARKSEKSTVVSKVSTRSDEAIRFSLSHKTARDELERVVGTLQDLLAD